MKFQLLLAVILALICGEVLSLKCLSCNSYINGNNCKIWDGYSYVKDCKDDKTIDQSKKVYCYSIDQNVMGRERVVRGCTNINYDGCLTRVGVKDVKLVYCTCSGDKCNA